MKASRYEGVKEKTTRKGTLFKCLVVVAVEHYWGHYQLKLTINANQFKSNVGF